MKTYLAVILAAMTAGAATMLYAGEHPAAEHPKATSPKEEKATVTKPVYVCPDCHAMALKAGKCKKCEKDRVPKHLLGVKGGQAMLCDCPADCQCDAKGLKDGKCACGKAVMMIDCKGLYCCKMGCALSKKEGKCPKCGMETKKCE